MPHLSDRLYDLRYPSTSHTRAVLNLINEKKVDACAQGFDTDVFSENQVLYIDKAEGGLVQHQWNGCVSVVSYVLL